MSILGITISAAIIWLVVAAILAIIETLTMGLTTIWFAGGALAAAVAALAGLSTLPQIMIFLAVSVILILITRPLVKKKLKVGGEKTNVEALTGKNALITEAIKPFHTGQAKVDGLVWTAIAKDSSVTIENGTTVRIEAVEGVKLVVSPLD